MAILMFLFRSVRPFIVNRLFGKLQLASAAWMSFSHGTNDAQKTMGIIALTLFTASTKGDAFKDLPGWLSFLHLSKFDIPFWVKVTCAITMAAGTAAGGWRIIRTMGHHMVKLQPVHGFAAQTTAALVIETATHFGIPLSTTHVISGSIMGVGSSKRLNAVKWGVAGRMIVRGTPDTIGELTDPSIQREAVVRARARLAAPYPESGPEQIRGSEVFYEIATRPPELIVFGAGHDAAPVAQLAWAVGFSVTIVDARQAFLTAERFPGATLVCAHFSQFAVYVNLSAGSFVLIMNHHVERDQECLRFSIESDAGYIGVLGPRSRFDRLLAGLADRGYVPESSRLASVRSPVGLALGAETPQEVAVSILSEILAIRRGFAGGFLSGSVASLHRPVGNVGNDGNDGNVDNLDKRVLATS